MEVKSLLVFKLLVFFVAYTNAEILIRGSERVSLGSEARLQCIARDYDVQTRKMIWFHNGRLVTKSSRNTITELFNDNEDDYGLSELRIPEVRLSDAGRYTCKANKNHEASFDLTVH
ncbi:uncharacterized protein LOC133173441 [Saccostrea echinata]|uniref:uncharacterized protein LOC133173441 n=1 Tax=Saccostrea echinata TaxID=191078 RepID=UPI002A81D55A|nr:uncharacterized protein LOC133173441 [Saccostrea echinata]